MRCVGSTRRIAHMGLSRGYFVDLPQGLTDTHRSASREGMAVNCGRGILLAMRTVSCSWLCTTMCPTTLCRYCGMRKETRTGSRHFLGTGSSTDEDSR